MTIYTSKNCLLLFSFFAISATYLIILPVVPVITVEKGLRPAFSGWFVASYGAFLAIGSLVGVKLAIRHGQHRVIVASFFIFGIMFLPIGAIELMADPTKIAATLLVSRAIQGFTAAIARVAI